MTKQNKIKIYKKNNVNYSRILNSPESLLLTNPCVNSVFNMKQWAHPCQILTFTWL